MANVQRDEECGGLMHNSDWQRFRISTRAALLVVALVLGLASGTRHALAQPNPLLLGHAVDATVQLSIVVRGEIDGKPQVIWYAAGSGSVVSPDGLILTNAHLITPTGIDEKLAELEQQLASEGKQATLEVDGDRFMVALSDGRHLPEPRYLARVVASDTDLDLAVLRIDADAREAPLDPASLDLPALPLGRSDAVNLGDPVHVFGFPAIGSGSLTYTVGIVSGFLFDEGIDGTAWINTDAITSGGNSGGAALNDAGELIGVPTSGSQLDCRPGDTNRDGTIGPDDVGCIPTGGSLTQLRPIDLARPLLASVDARVAGEVGTSAGATLTPETDRLQVSLAAAEGCAARGDWRCAVNFYADALGAAPDDTAIAGSLYDAYLALSEQEADAGRLDSARAALSSAAVTDPSRPEASAALTRLAPYRRAIHVDSFRGEKQFVESSDLESRSSYDDGGFTLTITKPGLVSGYPLTKEPLAGENYAALLRIDAASGDGMVTIEARTDPAGGQWVFGVDPGKRSWEVLQFDEGAGQFMPAAGPFTYGDDVGPELESVELRVTEGFPILLVNGVDVAAEAKTPLPEIGNRGALSFGALMRSEGTAPFTVTFDEIALYELA